MQPNKPRTSASAGEASQAAETSIQSPAGAEVIVDPSLRAAVGRRTMEAAAAQATAETAEDPQYDLENIIAEVHGWDQSIASPGASSAPEQPAAPAEAPVEAPVEAPTEQPEQSAAQPEKLTKTAEAEQKLENVNARIEEIKSELEVAYRKKGEAHEVVEQYEAVTRKIGAEISGLQAELGKYKADVRETGQTLTEKLKQGLNLVKDILKGDNKAIRKTLQEAMTANDQNEVAKTGEAEATEKISDAFARRDNGEKELATAKKAELSADAEITALTNELSQREFEAGALEEEIGIRKVAEERAAEQSRIKEELAAAGLSISEARRRLVMDRAAIKAEYDQKTARFESLASDIPLLAELGVQVEGYSQENLNARLAELEAERDEKLQVINDNLDAIDEYFPTFTERVGAVLKNASMKSALGVMRRKNVIKNIHIPETRVGERVQPSAEEALDGIDPSKRDTAVA